MADCFISYRRVPSASLALLIQEKLKNQHRIDAYVDTTRTDSTKVAFPERLMAAIDESSVFVCLLGKREGQHTLESEWVLKEIRRAHELKKFCIPIFQESYIPLPDQPDFVEYLLNFDGVHVFDQKNIYMDAAVTDIAKLIQRPDSQKSRFSIIVSGVLVLVLLGILGVSLLNTYSANNNVTETPELNITTAVALVDIEYKTEHPTITPTDTPTSISPPPSIIVLEGTPSLEDVMLTITHSPTVSNVIPPPTVAFASLPDGTDLSTDYLPPGVIEGSRYSPGQQLRVQSTTGLLNLRKAPALDAAAVLPNGLPNGSFVAILAGPVKSDSIEWWQVQTANGAVGWIAARIDGQDTLVS